MLKRTICVAIVGLLLGCQARDDAPVVPPDAGENDQARQVETQSSPAETTNGEPSFSFGNPDESLDGAGEQNPKLGGEPLPLPELPADVTLPDSREEWMQVIEMPDRDFEVYDPVFSRALAHSDREIQLAAFESLPDYRALPMEMLPFLTNALDDPEKNIRLKATALLMKLGPAAAIATPALIRRVEDLAEDESVRGQAVQALGAIGPEAAAAVPAFVALLERQDLDYMGYICMAVVEMGPVAEPTAPGLTENMLADQTYPNRSGLAAMALASLGHMHEVKPWFSSASAGSCREAMDGAIFATNRESLAPLVELGLQHANPGVRSTALTAVVGSYGTKPLPNALTLVTPLLDDPDEDVQTKASETINRLVSSEQGLAPAALFDRLSPLLDASNDALVASIADGIAQLGLEIAPKLWAIVRDEQASDMKRTWAAFILRRVIDRGGFQAQQQFADEYAALANDTFPLGVRAFASIPILDLGEPDASAGLIVLEAYRSIKPVALRLELMSGLGRIRVADAAEDMWEAVLSEDTQYHDPAFATIQQLGPLAERLSPRLIQFVKDRKNPRFEPSIMDCLARMNLEQETVVPFLIAVVNDQQRSTSTRLRAARALGPYPDASDRIVPALVPLLDLHGPDVAFEETNLCQTAIETLTMMGEAAAPAVPKLIAILGGDNETMVRECAQTLGAIGSAATPAIPGLVSRVHDETPYDHVRETYLKALVKIGPTDQRTLEALVVGLQKAESDTPFTVIELIQSIGPKARPILPKLQSIYEELPETNDNRGYRLLFQKVLESLMSEEARLQLIGSQETA
jgi:HEAT repeat protein